MFNKGEDQVDETFDEFKNSFSYASRTDLNFKFFKALSAEDTADFMQNLLDLLGDAYDSGDVSPLISAAYEAQLKAYAPAEKSEPEFDEDVFASLAKPLSESKAILITTSGHFVDGDDPNPFGSQDMSQDDAIAHLVDYLREAPELSSIPADIKVDQLKVRHPGYDVRSPEVDANVTFPIDRMREAVDSGRLGSLTETHFSFPGATAIGRLKKAVPDWVKRVQDLEADVAVLVPV